MREKVLDSARDLGLDVTVQRLERSTRTLADVLDAAEVRQASPEEVRAATGFSVGGVPPFGHGLPVVLDEALLGFPTVWAAGGDGHSLFAVDPRRLIDCTS